jgi:hypothetical protein
MDARRFFCFAKNEEQPMTGSMAVVGGLPALSLMPYALSLASVVRRLPALRHNPSFADFFGIAKCCNPMVGGESSALSPTL